MTKINYVIGDATSPKGTGKKIICHICNDIGAWGAGFVLALSNKWKEPEEDYRGMEKRVLGTVQIVVIETEPDILVANMIAQHGIATRQMSEFDRQPPIRYGAVRACLAAVNDVAYKIGATLHMPRIGCGLAGGKWEDIEKIIRETVTVDVTVYDLK